MPWRLAFALQADGWWLRQDIVWAKKNTMPESVRDRCTKAHEYVFLLAKSERYYFDQEAISEAASENTHARLAQDIENQAGTTRANGGSRADRPLKALAPKLGGRPKLADHGSGIKSNGSFEEATSSEVLARRNKRSVWFIGTEPFREAHFATFPTALVEPCILAGTSEKGCCAACGAPWRRVVARTAAVDDRSGRTHELGRTRMSGTQVEPARAVTTGWEPSCACAAALVPCIVLDPFGGAGTTALVADRLQRNAILIELNPKYAEIAERRILGEAPLLASVTP